MSIAFPNVINLKLEEKVSSRFIELIEAWLSKWGIVAPYEAEFKFNSVLFSIDKQFENHVLYNDSYVTISTNQERVDHKLFELLVNQSVEQQSQKDTDFVKHFMQSVFSDCVEGLLNGLWLDTELEKTNQILVSVLFQLSNCSIRFDLDYALFNKLNVESKNSKRIVELKGALEKEPVNVQVVFSSEEIGVDKLIPIKVGDVIKMNQKLEEPFNIHVNGKELNLKGYLVKNSGFKSVIVVGE